MQIKLSKKEMDHIWDALNFTMSDYEGCETKEWFKIMRSLLKKFDTDIATAARRGGPANAESNYD